MGKHSAFALSVFSSDVKSSSSNTKVPSLKKPHNSREQKTPDPSSQHLAGSHNGSTRVQTHPNTARRSHLPWTHNRLRTGCCGPICCATIWRSASLEIWLDLMSGRLSADQWQCLMSSSLLRCRFQVLPQTHAAARMHTPNPTQTPPPPPTFPVAP